MPNTKILGFFLCDKKKIKTLKIPPHLHSAARSCSCFHVVDVSVLTQLDLTKCDFFPPYASRHGYYGTSGPPAPVKVLTDLKLHLANPSHPISSSSLSDMVVIHPGAVLAMLDLLPSVSSDSQPEVRKRKKEMCWHVLPVKMGEEVTCRAGKFLLFFLFLFMSVGQTACSQHSCILKKTNYTFSLFSFPSVFYIGFYACKRSLKLKSPCLQKRPSPIENTAPEVLGCSTGQNTFFEH